tara:strand:+ start:1139 stop:2203 length:1065 start_codon:yes stop_codon:yes gene_type:complete
MSKAAELAALIGSQSALSNRNLIINGAMQVAQRATSVTSQTGNGVYHTVDRFLIEQSGATYDMSQSTTVPSGQGFSYSLKTVLDGAFTPSAAQFFIPFEQRIEGQNLQHLAYGTSAAKSVTLSFWIRSSKTGTYVVEFFNANSTQSRKYSKQYTINAANTWEHKTLTWEGDTVRSFDNNNDLEAAFFWWITAGTNFTSGTIPSGWENSTTANRAVGVPTSLADNEEYYLTGVQLELGEQATPFEHRSFHDEFMRCQRYYQEIHGGSCEPSSSSVVETSFTRLPMRAAPTGSVSAAIDIEDPNVTTYTQSSGAIAVGNATARAEKIGLSNFSGLGTSKSFFIKTTGGHIQLDAEL